jgi:hypothetical protein
MGLWADWQRKIVCGEITEDIPELTQTTLEMSRKVLDKSMGDPWWEVFSDDVIDDVLEIVRSVVAEDAYIMSKADSIETYELPKEKHQELKSNLKEIIKGLNTELKSEVSKAVIIGTIIYLSGYAHQLDETLKIDDNLINNIRNQLMLLSEKVLLDFGNKIQELMEN